MRDSFLARLMRSAGFGLSLMFIQSPLAQALDIDVTQFKLANGMEVVVIPDHRAPVVTHMVWYRVGAADEVSGKSGLAHFLEHLMFKGTKTHPPGQFDRLVDINGGDGNAFTTQDYTAYFQRIASDRLELVMQLEADRMQNLVLTNENVLPELNVVREERRQRTENDPGALLGEQLDAAMYTAHPYGKPIIGWMSEVAKLTREDALDFYKAHYTPANAILVVAGDADPERVKALAEKSYGGLQNTFTPKARDRTPEPAPIASRRVEMRDARVSAAMVQRSYLGPSMPTAGPREVYALELLADILGDGTRSRFYKSLVVDQKIAAYAGAWYSGDGLDSGKLGVYAAPNPGSDIGKVEQAMDAILADVIKNGVTEQELTRVKRRAEAEQIYALDDLAALARMAGMGLATGLSIDTIFDRNNDMAQVTVADVKAAAAKVIDARRSVTGVLLPEEAKAN
jgi:zinc protease